MARVAADGAAYIDAALRAFGAAGTATAAERGPLRPDRPREGSCAPTWRPRSAPVDSATTRPARGSGAHSHAPLAQTNSKGIEVTDQPDPLAVFRALADRYARHAAEQDCNAAASTIDEVRRFQWGLAAGWRSAEGLVRHTLAVLDNSRTTLDNPPASGDAGDARRRALAHNAVGTALNAHGEWLPLSVREAVADAVLATLDSPGQPPCS